MINFTLTGQESRGDLIILQQQIIRAYGETIRRWEGEHAQATKQKKFLEAGRLGRLLERANAELPRQTEMLRKAIQAKSSPGASGA